MKTFPLIRFIDYLRINFPRASAVYVFLTVLSALLDASTVLLIAPIFDLLMNQNALTDQTNLSQASRIMLSALAYWQLPRSALAVMFIFVGVVVVRNLVLIGSDVFAIYIKQRMTYKFSVNAFESVLNANWSFYLNRNQGDFLNVLTREIMQTQYAFVYFSYCLSYALQIALFIGVALWVSWQLSLICVAIGFALISPFLLMMRWNYRWGEKASASASVANGIVQETFALAKVIQAFANQRIMMKYLRQAQRQLTRYTFRSQALTASIHHAYYPMGLLTVVLGYYLSIKMALPFSALSMILFAMWKSMPALSGLMRQLGSLAENLPSFDNIIALQKDAEAHRYTSGDQAFTGFTTALELKSIDFAYQSAGSKALAGIDITIPKGQMVALVGRSGSGKSTLVDIIMGFHKIQSGSFEIDGQPFERFDLTTYRRRLGYVSQNSLLFNTSVRDNFLWINPDLSEQDLIWACQQAHALDFVQALPEGFDTVVGDRGVRLSGGQLQRLALARAIASKPELLILDEATSALDSESEAYIQQSIDALTQDMTILVIAHRLSTIKKADFVYVLDQGQVIEAGPFQALERSGGIFKGMLEKQNIG